MSTLSARPRRCWRGSSKLRHTWGNPARHPGAIAAALFAVGATIALLGLFASPSSGASMNPARTLGPGIVGANLTGWWGYVFGDLIGAALAVAFIGLVRGLPDKAETQAAEGGGPRR
jgi:hypothetical protein